MEHTVAQAGVDRPGTRRLKRPSLGEAMAAAAAGSVGRRIGASLATEAQQIIEKLRQPKN
jgi:hypothetical protein